MLHSPEDTLQAYREVSCYTIDAIIEAKEQNLEGSINMILNLLEKEDE